MVILSAHQMTETNVLQRVAPIVAISLILAGPVWVEEATGPLAQMIEQSLVALTLVLLVPLLTPWLK